MLNYLQNRLKEAETELERACILITIDKVKHDIHIQKNTQNKPNNKNEC